MPDLPPARLTNLLPPLDALAAQLRAMQDQVAALRLAVIEQDQRPLRPATPGDGVLRVPEAAAALGISDEALYARIKRGELRAFRVGRAVRVYAADIEAIRDRHVSPFSLADSPTPTGPTRRRRPAS